MRTDHVYKCRKCKRTFLGGPGSLSGHEGCPKCGHVYWDWLTWPEVHMEEKKVPATLESGGPEIGEATIKEDGTAEIVLNDSPAAQEVLRRLQAQPPSLSSRGKKKKKKR